MLQIKTSKVCARTEGRKEGGVGIRIFYNFERYTFFLACVTIRTNFLKRFCSSCGGECPSTANFCRQCGQQLNLSQVSNKGASSELTRKNCLRSISIGDILTQPSLVCWKSYETSITLNTVPAQNYSQFACRSTDQYPLPVYG